MQNWLLLSIAIASEVIATSFLKDSNGFTRLGPSIVVIIGYVTAFYFLSLVLKTIPVGVVYAIWSGAGIALIALVAWVIFGQILDLYAVIGITLIMAGVLVISLLSKTVSH